MYHACEYKQPFAITFTLEGFSVVKYTMVLFHKLTHLPLY